MGMTSKLLRAQPKAEKRTVTAIRCIATLMPENPWKQILKFAYEHKTVVDSMKTL